MKSIQETGASILSSSPEPFYILGGPEYGVKQRYIESLAKHYGNVVESPTVWSIISLMTTKRLVPLMPTLYVVRYDESFVAELDAAKAATIKSANIRGTVLCIYEDSKQLAKLDKFLPDCVTSVDSVATRFVDSYLRSEFHGLPDSLTHWISEHSENYSQARNICRAISRLSLNDIRGVTDVDLEETFARSKEVTETQLKIAIASRNGNAMLKVLEEYTDSADQIMYSALSVAVELDKLMDNRNTQSPLRNYVNRWNRYDVYHLFTNVYKLLIQSRSITYDTQHVGIYLAALIQFSRIPSVEELHGI